MGLYQLVKEDCEEIGKMSLKECTQTFISASPLLQMMLLVVTLLCSYNGPST